MENNVFFTAFAANPRAYLKSVNDFELIESVDGVSYKTLSFKRVTTPAKNTVSSRDLKNRCGMYLRYVQHSGKPLTLTIHDKPVWEVHRGEQYKHWLAAYLKITF